LAVLPANFLAAAEKICSGCSAKKN